MTFKKSCPGTFLFVCCCMLFNSPLQNREKAFNFTMKPCIIKRHSDNDIVSIGNWGIANWQREIHLKKTNNFIVIFSIYSKFRVIWTLGFGCIVCKTHPFIISNHLFILTKTENRTKKSLTQLSQKTVIFCKKYWHQQN